MGGRLAAIVLAGGGSRRMGGGDKTAADVAGQTLLRRVLAGLPPGTVTVVVGDGKDLPAGTLATLEDPPGAGPAAAVLAGWRVLRDGPAGAPDVVLVLAGDAPFADPVLPRLLARLAPLAEGSAAAVATDPDGVLQPLLAAFTARGLDAALREAAGRHAAGREAAGRGAAGRSARSLLDGLEVVTVPVTADEAADVDTPADLAHARARLAPGGRT